MLNNYRLSHIYIGHMSKLNLVIFQNNFKLDQNKVKNKHCLIKKTIHKFSIKLSFSSIGHDKTTETNKLLQFQLR